MTMRDASEVIAEMRAMATGAHFVEAPLVIEWADALSTLPASTPPGDEVGRIVDPHTPSLPGQPVKMVKVFDSEHGTVMRPAAADYYTQPAAAEVVMVPREATMAIRGVLYRTRSGFGDDYMTPEQASALWAALLDAAIKGDSHAG